MIGSNEDMVVATMLGMTCGHPITALALWCRTNPAAVTLVFGEDSRWTFDRNLLDGRGEGDVRVVVNSATVTLHLLSVNGMATVVLPVRDVEAFLDRTREICSDDQIEYDVDAWLRELGVGGE